MAYRSLVLRLKSFAFAGLLLLGTGQALAALVWQPFDLARWATMTQSSAQPTAVVFTTTDCAYCPQTIHTLADTLHKSARGKVKLAVVVIDGAELTEALAGSHHYQMADALYAFSGAEMPLRYAVDPQWRGETPYVVLIGKSGHRQSYIGPPPSRELANFVKTAGR